MKTESMRKEDKLSIKLWEPDLSGNEMEYLKRCIQSGWISSKGEFIQQFEEKFSAYCGRRYGIATCNGTVALHLSLLALGIGVGDEVIVPALTWISPVNVVTYTGAIPVFADVDMKTWNISSSEIENRITDKTKAVIMVHLYGHPCDMDKIMEISKKYSIYIIEDAAEAHGAEYKGKKVGSFGDIACFSFYGNKLITTGEGGMCITDDKVWSDKMRILRDHGQDPLRKFWHNIIGYNYRMTNMQAAIGLAQMERIDSFVCKKRHIAKVYHELLKDVNGIQLPPEESWAKSIFWLYCISIKDESRKHCRDKFVKMLNDAGIETRQVFYPVYKMPPYQRGVVLPNSEKISESAFSLPSGTKLIDDDLVAVTNRVKEIADYLLS